MGKLLVIEGTDCSGKETQAKLLKSNLEQMGYKITIISFPRYESPTGKIIGGPYLGKPAIGEGWFKETAPNVDPKVSCAYYVADRKYNWPLIEDALANNDLVILDRYTYSNMAHQGGKIKNKEERMAMYKWISDLEFKMYGLKVPDIKIFLHMSYEGASLLKKDRAEMADQNENNKEHLKQAELAYLEIAKKYHFKTIECMKDKQIKTKEEISQIIQKYVLKKITE